MNDPRGYDVTELVSFNEQSDGSIAIGPGAGPPIPTNNARAHMHAMAALRQATWEATQFLSDGDVISYVVGVLREVESDEP